MPGPYYYNAQATGTNDGSNETNAFTTFAAAVTAANANGDIIYQSAASQETVSAGTTYTFAANINVVCIDFTTHAITDPYAVGGYINSSGTVTFTGPRKVAFSHLCSTSGTLAINRTTGEFTIGVLTLAGTALAQVGINQPAPSITIIDNLRLDKTTTTDPLMFVMSTQATIRNVISPSSNTASYPSIFRLQQGPGTLTVSGDFSGMTLTSLVSSNTTTHSGVGLIWLNNVQLPSGCQFVTIPNVAFRNAMPSVYARDCKIGTTHIAHYYKDAYGEITVDSGKYANDTLSDPEYSMQVTTTSHATPNFPFITPWIEQWHEATAAISPYFAIARDGSATAYDNDEVWAEFEAKVTGGSVIKTNYSDKMALLGTPAAQTTDADTAWTGLGGTNWKGKVGQQSLTPAVAGTLSGRIVVGLANASFNWDTKVRF